MILVIGGSCQGKREFAERLLMPGRETCQASHVTWTDGLAADWDGFMKGRYCVGFHWFIRRLMLGEVVFGGTRGNLPGGQGRGQAGWEPGDGFCREDLMTALLKGNPHRILVTDETGCGIVPMEPFERRYREETGRICCLAARDASQVWRVCCGIGQRIK